MAETLDIGALAERVGKLARTFCPPNLTLLAAERALAALSWQKQGDDPGGWEEAAKRWHGKYAEAAGERDGLATALLPFAKIETPPNATSGTWVATTLHCNDQVTAHSVFEARRALRAAHLSIALTKAVRDLPAPPLPQSTTPFGTDHSRENGEKGASPSYVDAAETGAVLK